MIGVHTLRGFLLGLSLIVVATSAQAGISHYYGSTQTINGNAYDYATDVTTDASGNVFIVGNFAGGTVNNTYYDGTTDFDPGVGTDNRTPLQPVSYGDGYVTKINADGSYAWTQTFGTATGYVVPYGVATDSTGNVYITGGYSGSVDFDPGPGTDTHTPSTGFPDRFTVKLHADGSYAWMLSGVRASVGGNGPYHTKIKIDGNDDVYILGSTAAGSFDFDPTAGVDSITVTGGTAAYLSKYHADGSYAWTRIYTVQDSTDYVSLTDIAFDSSGNILVLGDFGGASSNPTVDVNPGAGSTLISKTMTSCYVQNFVAPLDTAGNYANWVLKMPRTYNSFALDSQDNIYLTGPAEDGSQSPFSCADYQVGGVHSASLTKIIGHTQYGWTQRFAVDIANTPTQPLGVGETVLVDDTDNAYVIGGADGHPTGGAASSALFIARFTNIGTMSWLNIYGAGDSYRAAMDASNNIYTAGEFGQSADFDPSTGIDTKTPTGNVSVYLSKFVYDTNNLAPTAFGDSITTDQSVKYSGTLSASDPENDPLLYSIVDKGSLGTAVITDSSTGAYTYTPGTGNSGTDSFTFLVNDGQLNSNTATVNVAINPALPGTDLVMTALSAPAGGAPGQSVAVSNSVRNMGSDKTGLFRVGIYLSTDNIITTSDTLLGYRYVNALGTNATSSANTYVSVPAALKNAPGGYYIGAIADYQNAVVESNENNNTISAPFEVYAPDLIISPINVPSTPVAPSQSVTVSGKVVNQGLAVTSGIFYVGLYFSTDSTITTGDTYLGSVLVGTVTVGGYANISKAVKIPAGLSAGTYYIGAIADYSGKIAESDETNNAASGAVTVYIPTPDLTVTSVSVSPTTVAQRGTLTLKGSISNIGTGKTGATSYAGFYLTDGVNDIYLKQLSVASTLNNGGYVNLSTTYILPAGFPAGTYTIKLVADHTNTLTEIDETNNTLEGNTVTVLP